MQNTPSKRYRQIQSEERMTLARWPKCSSTHTAPSPVSSNATPKEGKASAVGTLVDRTSRLLLLIKLPDIQTSGAANVIKLFLAPRGEVFRTAPAENSAAGIPALVPAHNFLSSFRLRVCLRCFVSPELPAPQLLLHLWTSPEYLARRYALDHCHNLCHAVCRH
jgi:hypothetical protein